MTRDHHDSSEPAATPVGAGLERIGDCVDLEQVGRGGQGIVYRARQSSTDRLVAIKIPRLLGRDPNRIRRRFEREIEAYRLLEHPGIVKLYSIERIDDLPVIVTEWIDGLPVDEWARGCGAGRRAMRRRLRTFAAICDAVAHAHERGVLHRDLKPSNVLIDEDDRPHVVDFGIARHIDATAHDAETDTSAPIGSPAFVAPEVLSGRQPADARADVFALGVLLREMLTGHRATERLRDSPGVVGIDLGPEIDCIIDKATTPDVEVRYQSVSSLAADVERHLAGRPIIAHPPSSWYVLKKAAARHPTVSALLALVLCLLLWFGSYSFIQAQRIKAGAEEMNLLAERASDQADLLRGALDDFSLLSTGVRLRRLLRSGKSCFPVDPARIPDMERWLRQADHEVGVVGDRIEASLAALEARARSGDSTRSDEPEFDEQRDQFLHHALAGLRADLEVFTRDDGYCDLMRTQLAWSREVDRQSTDSPRWTDALEAIADAPVYDGLRLAPQRGLLPVGPDPASGLWEFAHVRSTATEARPPRRGIDGAVDIGPSAGIVFVLLPGGRPWMGAQRDEPDAPHYDPDAQLRHDRAAETPVHTVVLEPFFISKHELTQAQWRRLAPDMPTPSRYSAGSQSTDGIIGWTHPADSIRHEDALRILRRHGLTLPTEAQWEYACRAGTQTPWSTGRAAESLRGSANTKGPGDGFVGPAPVGEFASNDFGLHDVHGNVAEWCLEPSATYYYLRARPGDGLRQHLPSDSNVVFARGGSFALDVKLARSAAKAMVERTTPVEWVGIRPARRVTR